MKDEQDEVAKPKRDHREERLRNLQALQVDGNKKIDETVRANLDRWFDQGSQPQAIDLRAGFARRRRALTEREIGDVEIVDRKDLNLPRKPPLASLTALQKGVGLRTALSLVFLAQTGKRALGADGRLNIRTERSTAGDEFGLVDLIAVKATHRTFPDGEEYAATTTTNRKRQIRNALAELDKPHLRLVELSSAGRGRPRFAEIRLRSEEGAHGTVPPRYKFPVPGEETIPIPPAFFLNGWVHALTNREIAMWLMLRDDRVRRGEEPADRSDLRVDATRRLLEYDLKRTTWDTHQNLQAFGLLDVIVDESRRTNGTTLNGKRAEPHRFQLIDGGLNTSGLEKVIAVVKDTETPLNL